MDEKNTTDKSSMMDKFKDKIDFNLRLPVMSRLKKRVKEIQELSKAKIIKVPMGNTHMFKTTEPQMFICGLNPTIKNGRGIITYQTYKKDGNNKKINKTYTENIDANGNKRKVLVNANYILDKMVIETIEYMKPIKKEVMNNEE